MKSSIAILLATCIFYEIWQISEAYYARDTLKRMKYKIVGMDRELTIDALMKRASINHLKMFYDKSPAYQMAEYVFKVKKKYTRMIFIYMRCKENEKQFKFRFMLDFLMEIQHIAAFIDNMVQMLEEWEDRDTRKKRITRTGGESVKSSQPNARKVNKIQTNFAPQKNNSELLTERQKQKEYMERKKILWSLVHGNSKANLKSDSFKKRKKAEEGFNSDMYHL
ncbi:hypothetical protein evm_012594 [Chilo suppressalis]|nr:hypothetical protein evm_012594 [Chilo suppressalis]